MCSHRSGCELLKYILIISLVSLREVPGMKDNGNEVLPWNTYHHVYGTCCMPYCCHTSNISHTYSPNLMFLILSGSCFCPIHWSQVLSWEWRCSWSSADRRCSNYIWVIDHFIAYQVTIYMIGLTVCSLLYCKNYKSIQVMFLYIPWWCHDVQTLSASLTLCERNPPVISGFPWQWKARMISFVFFMFNLNQLLNK